MKRTIALLAIAALIGGVIAVVPAIAQTAVSAEPNIVDPYADANEHSSVTGVGGGAFIGAADYLAVWFTNDSSNLFVHMQTTSATFRDSIQYEVYVDPGVGDDCMTFYGFSKGAAVPAEPYGALGLSGDCGDDFITEGVTFVTEEGPEVEGAPSAIHTLTFPRSMHEAFADGNTLKTPSARTRHNVADSQGLWTIDLTDVGTDYVISGGSVAESPPDEPPGKSDPPGKGKKKGCPKGKGKKKGACPGRKKPKPPKCPAFTPAESGKDAPVSVVTDAATEEKPVVVELEASAGGPNLAPVPVDRRSFVYQNVQVDSKGSEAGLYVKAEFSDRHDYDLYLYHPDGTEADHSGDFNAVPNQAGCGEGACESGSNYESLRGLRTGDCAGYTAEVAGFATTGGAVTLSIWLGEITADPAAPGDGGRTFALFYELLGL